MSNSIMNRFIVTNGNNTESALFSSPDESKAKDNMYGRTDGHDRHLKLWDLRQGEDDQPKLIDEVNNPVTPKAA